MARVDVVVIGGGIVGSACAYELARRGIGCIVLERTSGVAQEASGAAAGILGAQSAPAQEPLLELLAAGRRRWDEVLVRMRHELNAQVELVPCPGLQILATEHELRRAKKIVAAHAAHGLTTQLLTKDETCARERHLDPDRIRGALLFEHEHHLSSRLATLALARLAERHGAHFIFDAEVVDIECSGERRFRIINGDDAYETRWVVNAAGAWASRVGELVGLRVPVEPIRGQIYLTAPRPPMLRSVVLYKHLYVLQRVTGHLLVGASVERAGFDKRIDPEVNEGLRREISALLPSIRDLPAVDTWAGLRPAAPDELPIIGETRRVPGFIVAGGHWRNGILLGPVTGEIVASIIEGEQPRVGIEPYRLSRFEA